MPERRLSQTKVEDAWYHEAAHAVAAVHWPLHHVKDMLGHQSLEQTTTHLNVTLAGLQESMQRFDESVARCNPLQIRTA